MERGAELTMLRRLAVVAILTFAVGAAATAYADDREHGWRSRDRPNRHQHRERLGHRGEHVVVPDGGTRMPSGTRPYWGTTQPYWGTMQPYWKGTPPDTAGRGVIRRRGSDHR
jgi:hypothetical protein